MVTTKLLKVQPVEKSTWFQSNKNGNGTNSTDSADESNSNGSKSNDSNSSGNGTNNNSSGDGNTDESGNKRDSKTWKSLLKEKEKEKERRNRNHCYSIFSENEFYDHLLMNICVVNVDGNNNMVKQLPMKKWWKRTLLWLKNASSMIGLSNAEQEKVIWLFKLYLSSFHGSSLDDNRNAVLTWKTLQFVTLAILHLSFSSCFAPMNSMVEQKSQKEFRWQSLLNNWTLEEVNVITDWEELLWYKGWKYSSWTTISEWYDSIHRFYSKSDCDGSFSHMKGTKYIHRHSFFPMINDNDNNNKIIKDNDNKIIKDNVEKHIDIQKENSEKDYDYDYSTCKMEDIRSYIWTVCISTKEKYRHRDPKTMALLFYFLYAQDNL
jgi:hypothetical protein